MPQGFVLCSHLGVLGSKHLRQQLHHLQPLVVIVTLQEGKREPEEWMPIIRPCCAETVFPAPTEINLVTINRDRRTQRRQPEAKSQSDEVERDGGGKGGLLGEKPAETIQIKRGGGGGQETGRAWAGGRGSWGRDFIAAIILRRQHWSALPLNS